MRARLDRAWLVAGVVLAIGSGLLTIGSNGLAAAVLAPRAIIGPVNAEDLERIPGSRWLIASGLATSDKPANMLSMIDMQSARWAPAWPENTGQAPARADRRHYAGCPGLPDLGRFSPHGLALRVEGQGRATLYVVNDGPRAGVEIYRVDTSRAVPSLDWIGCVVAPAGSYPNAVAAMPDGGFLMSSMMFGSQDSAVKGLLAGEPTGEVFRWRPKRGFALVPGSRINGANGVTVSPDGNTLFVNAWSARQVVRLPLTANGLPRKAIHLDFMPDNIKWSPQDGLIVTGQRTTLPELMGAMHAPVHTAPFASTVLAVNPMTMRIAHRQTVAATADFGGATTAIRVGDQWWVGSFRADRVARWPVAW